MNCEQATNLISARIDGEIPASDQAAARTALQSGQIPDAYRDLVRDYFERE